MNTTHTNEPIEQKEKPREARLLEELELRDYFAAKTLQGMYASGNLPKSVQDEELAAAAYQVADAMLKARDEQQAHA